MRKLIDNFTQENIIECDGCPFVIKNETNDPYVDSKEYINVPCPECGTTLLTEKDYLEFKNIVNSIKFLNKYFSWLTIFLPKKKIMEHL